MKLHAWITVAYVLITIALIIWMIWLIIRSIAFPLESLDFRVTMGSGLYRRGTNTKILLRILLVAVIYFAFSFGVGTILDLIPID